MNTSIFYSLRSGYHVRIDLNDVLLYCSIVYSIAVCSLLPWRRRRRWKKFLLAGRYVSLLP